MIKKISLSTLLFCLMIFSASLNIVTAQAPNELENTSWTLASVENENGQLYPVETTSVTLEFSNDSLGGNGGCNSYGGAYQFGVEEITIDGVFMTEMYCMDEEVMDVETAYIGLLAGTLAYDIRADGTLILWNETADAMFNPIPTDPPPPLPTGTPEPEPCPPGVMDCGDPCDWAIDCTDPCIDLETGEYGCEPEPCPEGVMDCGDPCDWAIDCGTPVPPPPPPPGEAFMTDGEIAEMDESVVVVETWMGRLAFTITDETIIEGELAVGAATLIEAIANEDGTYDAIMLLTNNMPEPLPCPDADVCIDPPIEPEPCIDPETGELICFPAEPCLDPTTGEYICGPAPCIELETGAFLCDPCTDPETGEFICEPEPCPEGMMDCGDPCDWAIDCTDPCIDLETGAFICEPEPEPLPLPELIICWTGVVNEITDSVIVIDGQELPIDADTEILGDLVEGALVYVVVSADGTIDFIELLDETGDPIIEPLPATFQSQTLELLNVVSSITDDGTVVIDGETIAVTDSTELFGDLMAGGMAFVYATRNSSADVWSAVYIEALNETMTGEVEQINNGTIVIDGEVMPMTADVRVMGNISVGDTVRVGQTSDSATTSNTFIQPLSPSNNEADTTSSVPLAVGLTQSSATSAAVLVWATLVTLLAVGTVVAKRN